MENTVLILGLPRGANPTEETVPEAHLGMIETYVNAVKASDVDRILSLYHADAVLMRIGQLAVGEEQIRQWWTDYLANTGSIKDFTIEQSDAAEDLVLIELRLHTEFGTAEIDEFMLLEDGKITRHATMVSAMHLNEPD